MRRWWLTSEQARFWRQDYDARTAGGVGAQAPARPQAVSLQPGTVEATQRIEAAALDPIEATLPLTAFAGVAGKAVGAADAGNSVMGVFVIGLAAAIPCARPSSVLALNPGTSVTYLPMVPVSLGQAPTVNKGLKGLEWCQNGSTLKSHVLLSVDHSQEPLP
jgi:hypothetical protein